MNRECPNKFCLKLTPPVKHGRDFRKSDSKWIQRFRCRSCKKTFSTATFSINYGQKRRRLNPFIYKLYASGCSQRRMALVLKTNLKTVARKLIFLSKICEIDNALYIKNLQKIEVQFDEMESFEHTKLKPLSIPLVVEKETRKILAIGVCEMPAKGLLALKSRRKYGNRLDERTKEIYRLFNSLEIHPRALVESDQNPRYQKIVRTCYPDSDYRQYKGRRGCVTGQGELKAGKDDPLFNLNHICGMIRDSVKRLARKTWCTTKRRDRLLMHLQIYVHYHNFKLTA